MPGALRDGAPDAWEARDTECADCRTGPRCRNRRSHRTDLPTVVGVESSGAIDFQASPASYVPRADTATLGELSRAAQIVDDGGELPASLASALVHGTSMGGARPKALITDGDAEYLAKFSTSDDILPVVKSEAVSIELARHVGLNVSAARLVRAAGPGMYCSSSVSTGRVAALVFLSCPP